MIVMTELVPVWPGTPVQAILGTWKPARVLSDTVPTYSGADHLVFPSSCWKNQMLPLPSSETTCTDVAVAVIHGDPYSVPPAELAIVAFFQVVAPGTCS